MNKDEYVVCFFPSFPLNKVAIPRKDESFQKSENQVNRWIQLFGIDNPVREDDFEDWHENTIKFFAALDSGIPVIVSELGIQEDNKKQKNREIIPIAYFNSADKNMLKSRKIIALGREYRRMPMDPVYAWPTQDSILAGTFYFLNPAFYNHAGRDVAFTGTGVSFIERTDTLIRPKYKQDVECLDHLASTIKNMAEKHGEELIIKNVTRLKYSTVKPYKFTNTQDIDAIKSQLMNYFEYDLFYIDGRMPIYLIQEKIDIRHEYRMVIIDGKPVAGAGCVENLCPHYNNGELFHPLTETYRRDGMAVNSHILVDRYIRQAEKVAADLTNMDPHSADIILDFGLDKNDNIVLIEANPIANFGLYAMNYYSVFNKILERLKNFPTPQDNIGSFPILGF